MTGIEDHLRLLLREARIITAQMEHERATAAAAAHYHLCQVVQRFLTTPPAFPVEISERGQLPAEVEAIGERQACLAG